MSVSSLAGATTQAMGEYSGPPFLRELSRTLTAMAMENIFIIAGAVMGTILLWIYIRR
jgi:hypothetical protein